MLSVEKSKKSNSFNSGIEVIKFELKTIPKKPGIYKMIDIDNSILYVGKAKNLQSRILSYTQLKRLNKRLIVMISHIKKIEINITNSEIEALLLESNLIKKYEPKFNILLKDDKSFSSIYLSTDHDYPQITTHRGKKNKNGEYFGPFTSKFSINKTIETLQKVFLLRNCSDNIFKTRSRPCLQYQINRCSAPCVDYISKSEYREYINNTIKFLSGKSINIKKKLSERMYEESEKQNFEKAATFRNQINALNNIISSQNINYQNLKKLDVLFLIKKQNFCIIQMSIVRNGSNYGSISHFPKIDNYASDISEKEIMYAFLNQYYKKNEPPKIVLTNVLPQNKNLLEKYFSFTHQTKIEIIKPQRGIKHKILYDLEKTASLNINKNIFQNNSIKKNLFQLEKLLNLKKITKIETYDNSHNQGSNAIGAFITFTESGFTKSLYRKFIIKGKVGDKEFKFNDDYSMMEEVLTRRFKSKNLLQNPDLIVIDGGKGHLKKINKIMHDLNLNNVFVLAIAKGKDRNSGNEKFFYSDNKELNLDSNDPMRFFLQNLRDEAHRFAIGFHRDKRTKSLLKNPIDEIPNIGKVRKKSLLNYFGSANAVKKATIEDLCKIPNINQKTAEIIFNFFNDS